MALSAIAAWVSCSSPSGAPNSFRVAACSTISCKRAAREAERRGADGRAEDVERRHRDLEAFAGAPRRLVTGTRHASNLSVASGCGAITSMRSAIESPGVGIDHEGGQALGAGRFAGAREHDVVVRDAAVGDPGLRAVEAHVTVAVRIGGRGHRGDVGAGFRLGQREGRDRLARRHRRQVARLQLRRAEERDRAGAEPLHREGEVGEPVAERQDLAREAERAHVEPRVQPAMLGRHHRLEEAGLAERRDARAAGRVDVVVRQAGQRRVGPARERGEAAMVRLEERPAASERFGEHQLPSNTGFCFAANAR